MRVSFHGAARGVTGSCHLVECAGHRILVDCGLFQGSRAVEQENLRPFAFRPADIHSLLLTHAHLDHCGRLPLLSKQGFRGEIITTAASRELARLVLLDAAGLQEEEARYQARRLARGGKARVQAPALPLYTTLDALNCLDDFGRQAEYGKPIDLAPGVRVTFFDAGHILGSAYLLLELEEAGRRRRVLFSGDLGYSNRPILRDPAPPPEVDVVVMESTYGDRAHKPPGSSVQELYEAIADTLERGGNVVIPTFALERAQEVLFFLREGVERGLLPRNLPVFLDSPMAISATEIFKRHPECYDAETARLFRAGRDPLHLPGLRFTRETSESMAINQIVGSAVIMAGSGMCTGGRIQHHLKHNLWRRESSLVFVGYAAEGTLARQIIDGAQTVRVLGEPVRVRARVFTIGGFSAHADQAELLAWHRGTHAERTCLVHGEPAAMDRLAEALGGRGVHIPQTGQVLEL